MGFDFRPRTIKAKLVLGAFVAVLPGLVVHLLDPMSAGSFRLAGWVSESGVWWRVAHTGAMFFAFIVLILMANQLVRPIRRISHAVDAMAAGDFRKRVRIRTNDEMEALGKAFNSLGDSLLRHEANAKGQAELLAGMVEASRLVSSSLDARHCGKTIAKAVCEQLGASSTVVYRRAETDSSVKVIGRSGAGQTAAWKRLATHTSDSGEYLVVSEQKSSDEVGESFLVGVPMRTGPRSVGAIVARFNGGTTRSDLRIGSAKADVLTAFGIHAASAITNAEVYSQTEKYSEILEDWVEHLSGVMQVTNAISPSLNLEETMSALTQATAQVLKSDECAMFLLDRHGDLTLRSCCSPNESRFGTKVEAGQMVTGAAFAEKRPMACYDAAGVGKSYAAAAGFRGALSAPLIVEDRAIGAITVYTKQPRHFTPYEMRMLTSIALHAAVVVRNADLYTREASIAETLQKGLVSQTPETLAGLRFSSKYMAALDEARVGGDFYDVTELRDGRVAVVIGDVSGKGLQAGIHLATCKYMLKALIYTYPDDPALVLCELNDAINHYFDLSFFVTVFCGVIDPRAATLTYASAGHPPAVLVCEEGRMHTSLVGTGIPVGAGQACDYEIRRVDINPTDMLLLYTDGVTDAVRDGRMLGVEGLHEIVFRSGASSPRELIDFVCRHVSGAPGSQQRDDIALMAISFDGIRATGTKVVPVGGVDERERIATKIA